MPTSTSSTPFSATTGKNLLTNQSSSAPDDDNQNQPLLSLNDIFALGNDDIEQHQHQSIVVKTDGEDDDHQQVSASLSLVFSNNTRIEATKLSNQLSRARLEINQLKEELATLIQSKKTVVQENTRLTANMHDAAKFVTAEYEKKLSEERAKTAAAKFEYEELAHQLRLKNREDELLDRKLSDLVVAGRGSGKDDDDDDTKSQKMTINTVRELRESIRKEVQNLSRAELLEQVFHIASEEVHEQIAAVDKVYAGQPNSIYGGYKHSDFVRNHCLFSAASAGLDCPVAQSFFKKCPQRHFAQVLGGASKNNNKKKLNSDLFKIAFHGTRGGTPAATNIQCAGFDPSYRVSMPRGYGEWCATGDTKFQTSLGYGGNNGTIIVLLVYTPPRSEVDCVHHLDYSDCSYARNAVQCSGPIIHHAGYTICNNPPDRKDGTYMLPLGLLTRPAIIDSVEIKNTQVYNTRFVDKLSPLDVSAAWKKLLGARKCDCVNESLIMKKRPLEKYYSVGDDDNDDDGKEARMKISLVRRGAAGTEMQTQQQEQQRKTLPSRLCDRLASVLFPVGSSVRATTVDNNNNNNNNTHDDTTTSSSLFICVLVDGELMMFDLYLRQVIQPRTGELFDLIIE